MNKEQLKFDFTILILDGNRYIEIIYNGQTKCLILDEVMKRVSCIANQATTCWKVYCKGDISKAPLVIKDLWQYLECDEEDNLLYEATEKGVVNVARYYYHETICIGG